MKKPNDKNDKPKDTSKDKKPTGLKKNFLLETKIQLNLSHTQTMKKINTKNMFKIKLMLISIKKEAVMEIL